MALLGSPSVRVNWKVILQPFLKDAAYFPQGLHRVFEMLQDRTGIDGVKRGRGKGQRTEIAHLETHVRHLVFLSKRPGPLDHAGLAIHPNNLARGHDLGQTEGDRTGAAAAVEERHAWLQV